MSVFATVSDDKKTVTIKIIGNFEFASHTDFRNSYRYLKEEGAAYIVDLSETEYMDSAALGMLVLLKDYAEELGGTVILQRPAPGPKKLLKTVNFEKMFRIQDN